MPAIKPTLAEAQLRLRIDADLADDLASAIEQAHAEMLAFLDRAAVYEDQAAFDAALAPAQAELDAAVLAGDLSAIAAEQAVFDAVATGMVSVPDLINAQLLLCSVAVGDNTAQEREQLQTAAERIMRRHRRHGV